MTEFKNTSKIDKDPQYCGMFDVKFYTLHKRFLRKSYYEDMPHYLTEEVQEVIINGSKLEINFNVNSKINTISHLLKCVDKIDRITIALQDTKGNINTEITYNVSLIKSSYRLSYKEDFLVKLNVIFSTSSAL